MQLSMEGPSSSLAVAGHYLYCFISRAITMGRASPGAHPAFRKWVLFLKLEKKSVLVYEVLNPRVLQGL